MSFVASGPGGGRLKRPQPQDIFEWPMIGGPTLYNCCCCGQLTVPWPVSFCFDCLRLQQYGTDPQAYDGIG